MTMKQITSNVKEEWNEKGTPVVLNRKQKRTFKALLPKFSYIRKTVRQFFKWISDDIVDCLPIGQRLCIQGETTDKSREIIESMFLGLSINTITLTKTFDGSEYEYESVDGGHRKRAIRGFLRNKFRVFGKYFKDFDKEDKQRFLDYELNFCIYEPLTNAMKGQVFQTLNKTTEVSDQEMLNSFGNIPIANAVRQTVRTVKGIDEVHPLFTKTSSKKAYEYIDYTNNSPDDLDFLWFHIWPNAYKNNTTSLAKQKLEDGSTSLHYATEEEKGYINSLNFKVDGELLFTPNSY